MIQKQIQIALDDAVKKLEQKFGDISPVLHDIVRLIESAINLNFLDQGRWSGNPTNINIFSGGSVHWKEWSPGYDPTRKYPTATILESSGVLHQQIEILNTAKNQISVSASAPYAAIHQFGGTIQHPGGTPYFFNDAGELRFFSKKKARELEAKGRKVKYTQAHTITIPPRPYIVLTEEDLQEIVDIITSFIHTG